MRGSSIRDYVRDVATVAEGLDTSPILVGHSMGAFVGQHYLASGHRVAGAILVSPVPMSGAWGATLKLAVRHPWRFLKTNLTLDVGAVVETREAARDLLVSDRVPEELFQRCFERLERASYRVYLDLLFNRPDLGDVDVPALVIGGTEDAFFSLREWRRTARALRAPMETLQGASHQPMWENEGTELVSVIAKFADEVGR